MTPARRRLARRIAIVLLAPVLFVALLELSLGLAGVHADRYALGPGSSVERYWVAVDGGYARFSPRRMRRHEDSPAFVRDKPPNGYRVFVLGESTVEGFPYGFGDFAEWLRVRLRAMLPGRFVEVVNAGNAGWNAEQVATLAEECLEHDADLLVWAVGHNEFHPWSRMRVREEIDAPIASALRRLAWRLRTTHALARLLPARPVAPAALPDRELGDDSPCYGDERPDIERHFRANVDRAAIAAANSGSSIVLCTMPRNVRTYPPIASAFSARVHGDPALRARWDEAFNAGSALLEGEDRSAEKAREALAALRRAAEIDATPARLHFAIGRALERCGEIAEARRELHEALERDGCPNRAQAWTQEAVREVARARRAPMVDLERVFDQAGLHGMSGDELICDNVHPNFDGHERIAEEVLTVLERDVGLALRHDLDVPREQARELLGISRYTELQAHRAECLANFRLALQAGVESDLVRRTRRLCAEILASNPRDFEVGSALALLEAVGGRRELAAQHLADVLRESREQRVEMIVAYRLEPPYRRALDAAGFDPGAVARDLSDGERSQIESRVAAASR
ncbi:MAG TPA: SGNH/GDSL hydrolase family protein [Planctomycetota bacterium]|nr:SGNH/GDSL hydrolase family protein [Planctomycetota bacterium]